MKKKIRMMKMSGGLMKLTQPTLLSQNSLHFVNLSTKKESSLPLSRLFSNRNETKSSKKTSETMYKRWLLTIKLLTY